jgi:pyrroloquinoline quinone biosynthesis protein D
MDLESIPRLGRGCRLAEDNLQGWILLIPEGVLRLSGPGPHILQRCDGARTVGQIVADLESAFPGAEAGRIATETTAFLEKLRDRRIVVIE